MTSQIDEGLYRWLDTLGQAWELSIQEVAFKLAEDEIANRVINYPRLRDLLGREPIDLGAFASAARECWVLGGRFDSVRFNSFLANGLEASAAIERKVRFCHSRRLVAGMAEVGERIAKFRFDKQTTLPTQYRRRVVES